MQAGVLRLSNNFGVNFAEPAGKIRDWFDELEADGWTEERFKETVSWLMRHHKWPTLTLANFTDVATAKLHPRSWMIEQVGLGNKCHAYKVGDVFLYTFASDDIPLPIHVPTERPFVAPESPQAPPETHKDILSGVTGTLKEVIQEIPL